MSLAVMKKLLNDRHCCAGDLVNIRLDTCGEDLVSVRLDTCAEDLVNVRPSCVG